MDTIQAAYETCRGTGPKYRAVAESIRRGIGAGSLTPGAKLPPVRELAWQLGITPGTVARAYSELTDAGVLEAEVGRGTFVARRPQDTPPLIAPWPNAETPETPEAVRDAPVSLFAPRLPDCGQVALLHQAFCRLAERPPADLLNYPSRAGFRGAREAVRSWLGDTPLGPVSEEDIVLSHGGQNGIGLVLQTVLRGRRPVVLVEELSYPGFRRAAELLRAEVVAVAMDGEGLRPDALAEAIRRHEPQVLCTSPEIHNPTGIFTPLSRREELAAVIRGSGLQIVEDDCYRVSRAHAPTYRMLLPDQAWYVSSISKILTPALRVGFAVAPGGQGGALRRSAEHGFFGLARPLADITEDLLTRPETREIAARVRARLIDYIHAAVRALDGHDVVWRDDMPFLWLTLPAGWRTGTFVQAAEARGVQIRPADEFALRDGTSPHAVRIGVNAQVPLDTFAEAVGRLRRLLDEPPEEIAI
ncbi:aminotransferase-like domain-containing protein [Roseivivax sp. CAU 1761]